MRLSLSILLQAVGFVYSLRKIVEQKHANAATLQGVSDQADQEDSSLWSTFVQKVKGGSATLMSKLKDTLTVL